MSTTFAGTRLDPSLRGSIMNIGESNFTPECLIEGVIVGIARELHDMFVIIQQGTGITARAVAGAGNGLRKNPELRKIVGDMFGYPPEFSGSREEAATDAAIAAQIMLG